MGLERIIGSLHKAYASSRGIVTSRDAMVCTAHPLASRTGLRILEDGGNVFEAAIAVSAVLNVVEPYNSHLGGDAFCLIYSRPRDELYAINSSGPAPRAAKLGLFSGGIPARGTCATSVPGQLGAWRELYERYGTMSWGELLAPSIRYAEEGFPCNPRLWSAISAAASELGATKEWAAVFLPKGRPPAPGEIFRQPELARTLRLIAKEGPESFYDGELASTISQYIAQDGGLMTEEDLSGFSPQVCKPIQTDYRGFTVYEQPPVSQGHILLEELNILEGFDLEGLDPRGADAVHLMVEAKKLAFADRDAHAGDPNFVDFEVRRIISKDHASKIRELVDLGRASLFKSTRFVEGETTYFAIADGKGNAVSFIQSLFHSFGCGRVVPGTGILLNNRMCGFSLDPSSPNRLEGGKRTVHTLNTYMVFWEDTPLFIGGTPGGDVQVQTNLQILTSLIDWEFNIQEAVERPRWASGAGLDLVLEDGFPPSTVQTLRHRGHHVEVVGRWRGSGAAQLVMNPESGGLLGASDPRCDGCAIGS